MKARARQVVTPFQTPGKEFARRIVVGLAQGSGAKAILDLWGGGESARAFVEGCPDAAVTSAEADERLWPELRLDAQQFGYAYYMGDIRDVEGRYDLIWADTCGPISKGTKPLLAALRRKLTADGWLVFTFMPARDLEFIFSGTDRLLHSGMWLERETGLRIRFFLPYQRNGGQWMWLVVLQRPRSREMWGRVLEPLPSDWHSGPPANLGDRVYYSTAFDIVMGSVEEVGYYGRLPLSADVAAELGAFAEAHEYEWLEATVWLEATLLGGKAA